MPLSTSPFAALTFIAAPAILTNAASVLALGTSNRFARAMDRARDLAARIDKSPPAEQRVEVWIRQFNRAERRTMHLLCALRSFYFGLGSLAGASLVSLIGAAINVESLQRLIWGMLTVALVFGVAGVGSIAYGCSQLVKETRLAMANISEEAAMIRKRFPRITEGAPGGHG